MPETLVVYAQQPAPSTWDASVFLAGPTPRDRAVASWRPAAVDLLRELWSVRGGGRLVVFVPETAAGGLDGGWEAQVEWEDRYLNACDVIAFWVPRDLVTLPGFTTNVEWGRWEASGKVVLGAPPGAPRTRYLFHYAGRHGVPTAHTVSQTMAAALDLVARRKGSVMP